MAVAGYDFLVNADVIAGLPGEKPEDFERTLSELIELGPANITVHTLAVKKASRLILRLMKLTTTGRQMW